MTPNQRLDDSLKRLADILLKLSADQSQEIQGLRQVVEELKKQSTDNGTFAGNLIKLAAAVIQVRTHTSNPQLRELPVPPYDLWLPFKAEDLTPLDSMDLPDAVRSLSEFFGRWQPDAQSVRKASAAVD